MTPQLPSQGAAAPPRVNGELVFDAPWQSRAFGVAASLAAAGRLDWADFQQALIERVGLVDRAGESTGEPAIYWRCWLDALSGLLTDSGLATDQGIDNRCRLLAARAPGHDH